jgi:hypothetical protein
VDEAGRPVWYCRDLESAATYWAATVEAVDRQAGVLGDRLLVVRFEDLCAAPDAVLQRLHAHVGAAAWTFPSVAPQVVSDAATRWRADLSEAQIVRIESIAGAALGRLGYHGEPSVTQR